MLFRAGINLSDVIVEGDDIYGDGVNVAARSGDLASPGSICISGSVYRATCWKDHQQIKTWETRPSETSKTQFGFIRFWSAMRVIRPVANV